MKLGVLFSGGKDSTYAAWLAKKEGYDISCLVSVFSENPDSYMFHTPNISLVEKQSKVMGAPLIIQKTQGKKEDELSDLEEAIKKAISRYEIQGVITGAVQSVYQASRIQKICNKLDIECFNPLWQKDELGHLQDLIKNKFQVMITAVSAYPLEKDFLGKIINKSFVSEIKNLNKNNQISMIGEGGEFETIVINCPLYKKPLIIKNKKISGSGNSWKMKIKL